MTPSPTITDRITLVMLDIRIWSGRKKLRPEDLHLSGGEIPPEDLVSLGLQARLRSGAAQGL